MPSTGTPASNSARSTTGAPSAYTDDGPPERMIAFGFLASISATGMVDGTISLYTRGLAHAARDELRVLRAEVDDEHGVKGLVCGHQTRLSHGRKSSPVYGEPPPAPSHAPTLQSHSAINQ